MGTQVISLPFLRRRERRVGVTHKIRDSTTRTNEGLHTLVVEALSKSRSFGLII